MCYEARLLQLLLLGAVLLLAHLRLADAQCSGSTRRYTEQNGTLSPIRAPNGQYFTGITCSYMVACPDPDHIAVALDGPPIYLVPGDTLRIFKPGDAATLYLDVPAQKHDLRLVVPEPSVELLFVSDDSGTAGGFDISYRCLKNMCGSRSTAVVASRYNLDLTFRLPYTNEACELSIECDRSDALIVFREFSPPATNWLDENRTAIPEPTLLGYNPQRRLYFTAVFPTSIMYQCVLPAGERIMEACVQSDPLYIYEPQALLRWFPPRGDYDGYWGDNVRSSQAVIVSWVLWCFPPVNCPIESRAIGSMLCRYTFQCEDGLQLLFSATLPSATMYLGNFSDNPPEWRTLPTPTGETKLTFFENITTMSLSIAPDTVWSWQFWCTNCPSKLESSALRLFQSKTYTVKYDNELCSFNVTCDYFSDLVTVGACDAGWLMTLSNGTTLESKTDFQVIGPVIIQHTPVGRPGASSCTFACQLSADVDLTNECATEQLVDVAEVGVLHHVALPTQPNGRYFNNMNCPFLLRCPTGTHISLAGSMLTLEYADRVEFEDPSTGERIASNVSGVPRAIELDARTETFFGRIFAQSEVRMRFLSNSIGTHGYGFRLNMTCLAGFCSDAPNATSRVVIVADDDEMRELQLHPFSQNQYCEYELQCSQPGHTVYVDKDTPYFITSNPEHGVAITQFTDPQAGVLGGVSIIFEDEVLVTTSGPNSTEAAELRWAILDHVHGHKRGCSNVYTAVHGRPVCYREEEADWVGKVVNFVDFTTRGFLTATNRLRINMTFGMRTPWDLLVLKKHDFVNHPVSFQWACVNRTELLEPCAAQNETIVAYEGEIAVPNVSGIYVNNFVCDKWIKCPDGQHPYLRGVVTVHETDSMTVIDPSSSLRQTSSANISVIAAGDTLRFTLRSDRRGLGWVSDNPNFVCLAVPCVTNTTNDYHFRINVSETARILQWVGGEKCNSTVECLVPEHRPAFDFHKYDDVKNTWSVVVPQVEGPDTTYVHLRDMSGAMVTKPSSQTQLDVMPVRLISTPPTLDFRLFVRVACSPIPAGACDGNGPVAFFPNATSGTGRIELPTTPFDGYFNNLWCEHLLVCPPGMNVFVAGLLTVANRGADVWTLTNQMNPSEVVYGPHPGEWNIGGIMNQIFVTDKLLVQFRSDDQGSTSGGTVLDWGCLVSQCGSNSTAATIALYDQSMGSDAVTIGSSFDNEVCTFIIGCVQKWMWMVIVDQVSLDLTVMQDIDGDVLPALPNLTPLPLNNMSLQFRAVGRLSRFRLSFQCFEPFTFEACIPGRRGNLDGPSGFILLPMILGFKYGADLLCTYRIRCELGPDGTAALGLFGGIVTHSAEDRIEVFDESAPGSGEMAPNMTTNFTSVPGNTTVPIRLFRKNATLFVRFVSDSRGSASGLTGDKRLRYQCFRSQCGVIANAGEPRLTHSGGGRPPVNISVDFDDSNCTWELRCSTPRTCLRVLRVTHENSSFMGFRSAAGAPITYESLKPDVQRVNRLWMHYRWPGEHNHSFGFSFDCVAEPWAGFCDDNITMRARRLWSTLTPTFSDTLLATRTLTTTLSASVSRTEEVTQSESGSTSVSTSITPPPTPSKTYTLSLTATETLTVSASPSARTISLSLLTATASSSVQRIAAIQLFPSIVTLAQLQGDVAENRTVRIRAVVVGSRLNATDEWQKERTRRLLLQQARISTRQVVEGVEVERDQTRGFMANIGSFWLNTTVLNVSKEEFWIEFRPNRAYVVQREERVRFQFPRAALADAELIYLLEPAVLRVTEPREPREPSTSEYVARGAMLASSLLSGSHNSLRPGRTSLFMDLLDCSFAVDEPLDPDTYPFQIYVGSSDDPYRYYVGQLLLNPAFLILVGVAFQPLLAALHCILGAGRAKTAVFYPSILLIPVLYLLQDSLAAVWIVMVWEELVPYKVAAAGVLVAFYVPLLVYIVRQVWIAPRRDEPPFGAWYKREDDDKPLTLGRFYFGLGSWEDDFLPHNDRPGFVRRYGYFFSAYRPEFVWFLVVELALELALSGVVATLPLGDCRWQLGATFVLYLCYVAMAMHLRPYLSMFEQGFQAVTMMMDVAGLLVALTSIIDGLPSREDLSPSYSLFGATMAVCDVKATIDMMFLAYDFLSEPLGAAIARLRKWFEKRKLATNAAHSKPAVTTAASNPSLSAPLLSASPPPDSLAQPGEARAPNWWRPKHIKAGEEEFWERVEAVMASRSSKAAAASAQQV